MAQGGQRNNAGYSEIEPNGSLQYAPLSFQQERVFYLHKLSAEGPLWNRISCKRLWGRIDVQRLKEAVEALIARHSALRTRIYLVDGEPIQSRHEFLDGVFEYTDLPGGPAAGVDEQARAILARTYEEPLSLEGGHLFKAVLLRCGDGEFWLILKLHHIISDEATLRILWNDLKALYNSQPGNAEALPPLDLEYLDYAWWLREALGEDHTREQEAYWLCQFAGELPQLDLPADFTGPPNVRFSGALEKQWLPRELVRRLQSFSLDRRVIPFSTMLSAFFLLLRNYCGQGDIIVGTVFSGRHYSPKIRRVAGFFSNTVALRAHLDEVQTVEELVKSTHAQVVDAYEMQDYPFERLVHRLNPEREHKRNPLFRAMFNMVTGHAERHLFEGVHREEWLEPEISATQVDLFLDLHMNPGESEVRIEYNTDLFSRATIRRMLRHYVTLVERILDGPSANARGLSMLDAAEAQLVLSFGEGASEPAAFAGGVVQLLEERAARTPEQAALLFGDEVITCGQLNKRANQLAATLTAAGVAEADIVAIMLDRSLEMLLGVLAILKAGAAYLPIDPAFPQQRIEYILRDSGAGCLLVRTDAARALAEDNSSLSLKYILVDDEGSYTGDGSNTGREMNAFGPAYVIYTSGSTGKPKGVVVEHGALMNTLRFLEARYPLTGKTILLKTNFTFDVSTTELFGWLFDGGRLALLDEGAEKDPARLLEAIDKYRVTHINFVPSMLDAFLSCLRERDVPILERLRYVFVAGEALRPELANRFYSMLRHVRLENLYGPTEAAVYATWYSLSRGKDFYRVPIGRPIANMRSYILDEKLRLVPVGVTGELCLSGIGLARGYLNQPELTGAKFCPNPYWAGERIYRTGDLARWADDGLIQFLGRSDGQVKIRGFRVELGEVERKLLSCPGVAEAAVTTRTEQFEQKALIAYLVMAQGRDGSLEELRQELAAWLPGYMIPDFFVELERLPRLPSGKVDLQALPEPDREKPAAEHRAATAELEQTIIEIAEGLLNTTGLGPDSNFFRLGGNSLLTLRFVAALDEALGTSLSVMDFLELPTIAEIAKLVEPLASRSRPPESATGRPQGDGRASILPTIASKG